MPFSSIRVTVVTPEAPTHLSKTGEPTTISVTGLVKYIVIAVDEGEALAALELETPPSVEEVYPEEMARLDVVDPKGTAVLELLYPDEAAAELLYPDVVPDVHPNGSIVKRGE
jgi:hypothetical protein